MSRTRGAQVETCTRTYIHRTVRVSEWQENNTQCKDIPSKLGINDIAGGGIPCRKKKRKAKTLKKSYSSLPLPRSARYHVIAAKQPTGPINHRESHTAYSNPLYCVLNFFSVKIIPNHAIISKKKAPLPCLFIKSIIHPSFYASVPRPRCRYSRALHARNPASQSHYLACAV